MGNRSKPASPPRRRLLSVIIPAYNAANTLGEQLDALKAQEYDGDWEIIVVDNGSIDNTAKVVQNYQHLMPHLRLVHAPSRQNRSYSRNIGVLEARGDAFLFCDADDMVSPGWVSALAEALEEHDVVIGPVEMHTLSQVACQQAHYHPISYKEPFLDFLPVAMGCNSAISRKAFQAVGGFSEDFVRQQDVDLSWRLQLRGYSIHVAPKALVYYRPRETLWEVWKQAIECGEAHVNLFRHFAAYGMTRSSWRSVLRRYKRLIKRVPHLRRADQSARIKWLREAGYRWGRIRASLRYRILYL
jgi:glycosyltransferase involved in cell wall biosynthesis